ncbi:MAG TPA: VOC family protein [Pseudolysinimonas sp.]|nr:VOC family protein [Pseudolysinimonas sp.]
MTAALARIIVPVSSLESALPLYEEVLDLKRVSESEGVVVLALARNIEVMLRQTELVADRPDAGASPVYRVANVDAATAAASGLGCTVVDAPADQAWGERDAVLRDPSGNLFGLVTPL